MFDWFKKSNNKESRTSIATIRPESETAPPMNPIKIADLLLLEKAENWSEMIANCVVWANQQPSNPLPYFSAGNAYLKIGKPAAAVDMYRKAIEVSNKPAELLSSSVFHCGREWYGLGRAYTLLRERDEAENAFLQAITLDPEVPDIWNDLGIII